MNQHWTGFILVLQTEINGTNHKLKFVDKAISVSVGRSHGQYTELIIRLLLQWSIHWLDFVDIILNGWDFHIEWNDLKATVTPTDTHTLRQARAYYNYHNKFIIINVQRTLFAPKRHKSKVITLTMFSFVFVFFRCALSLSISASSFKLRVWHLMSPFNI